MEGFGSEVVHEQGVRSGRRPATSRAELERIAFGLFATEGFDATTVDQIARAAGIGRRTFFRYFESKNDVVWGDFGGQLALMRERFAACPPDQPLFDAVRAAVIDFNRFDPAEVPWHRRRMELILKVPALQAHSTLRYAEWRTVVAEFAATRLNLPVDDLLPRAVGHTALGIAISAYEQWLQDGSTDLHTLLDKAFRQVGATLGG